MAFDTAPPAGEFTTSTLGCATPRPHSPLFATLSQLLTPGFGFILSFVVILAAQYVRSPWRRVPPGPKGLPILGNALQLKDKLWMFDKDCKKKFGNSISADSLTLWIYQRHSRKYHVFKCSWPAHCYFE